MNTLEASRRLMGSRRLAALGRILASQRFAFVTGGAVRDVLLGLPVHDVDVVVADGAASAAAAVRDALGGRTVRLGRPPLVTWRVATPRFTVDLADAQGTVEADARRRDFTVNAMLWRLPRGPLVDLVGGLDDLAARRLSVVHPRNLRADPLRVLRGLRLHATLDLALTRAATEQLAAAAPNLRRVASERVVEELRALLEGVRVGRALAVAARLGILAPVLPGWDAAAPGLEAAGQAGRLSVLADSGPRWLGGGARAVMPAVLAAPAAGFPAEWRRDEATAALAALGWSRRSVRGAVAAAGLGMALAPLLGRSERDAREALVRGGSDPASALAWACAVGSSDGVDLRPAAERLWRWRKRFERRPPLLTWDEAARIAGLAPGPRRAEVLRALRASQASGAVRTRRQAREWLADQRLR